jgi:hypothetical protein
MSNVIPGTDLVASEGVKSPFTEYFDNLQAQQVLQKAQETAREAVETKAKVKTARVNDKKAAAQKLFDENKAQLKNGEIAQRIAQELNITYANAYYYVTRVFKR